MKICTKCKNEKHESRFSADKRRKDGLRSACKECCNQSDKNYRDELPDRYVRRLLAGNDFPDIIDMLPQPLVDCKREQLRVRRLLVELKAECDRK